MKKALFLSAIAFLAVNIAVAQPGTNRTNKNDDSKNVTKELEKEKKPDFQTETLKEEPKTINNEVAPTNEVKPGNTNEVKPGNTNEVKPGTTNEVKPGTTNEVKPGTGTTNKDVKNETNGKNDQKEAKPVENVYKPDPSTKDGKKHQATTTTADERSKTNKKQGKNDTKVFRDQMNPNPQKANTNSANDGKVKTLTNKNANKTFVRPSKDDAKKGVQIQSNERRDKSTTKDDKKKQGKLSSAKASTIKN